MHFDYSRQAMPANRGAEPPVEPWSDSGHNHAPVALLVMRWWRPAFADLEAVGRWTPLSATPVDTWGFDSTSDHASRDALSPAGSIV